MGGRAQHEAAAHEGGMQLSVETAMAAKRLQDLANRKKLQTVLQPGIK